jgi:hypothetical protein
MLSNVKRPVRPIDASILTMLSNVKRPVRPNREQRFYDWDISWRVIPA